MAKPIRRTGGFFGGSTLSVVGPADPDTSAGISGHDSGRARFDVYVGQLVRGWGYWRVGVYNVTNMRHERQRSYPDAAGGAATSSSVMTLTPRLYLTPGTLF